MLAELDGALLLLGADMAGVKSKKEETVRVVVRCRPLNSKEQADGRGQVVLIDPKMGTCALLGTSKGSSGEPPKMFTFDQVYAQDTQQGLLYHQTASHIVDSVLEGFNGTIFAYGQTGTGKTFTMEGMNEPPELRGIIPRAFHQIFALIASRGGQSTEFLVRASYLEIYNEEIRDLLSKQAHNRLDLKEDPQCGVYVRDLTSYVVKTTRECDKLRDFGAKNRHTGATAMNQDSSRSHSIYTITVESCETRPGELETLPPPRPPALRNCVAHPPPHRREHVDPDGQAQPRRPRRLGAPVKDTGEPHQTKCHYRRATLRAHGGGRGGPAGYQVAICA